MTTNPTGLDHIAIEADIAVAGAALTAFAQGPARRAADEVGASFDRAGERIAGALARAALSGENSFKRLAKVALEELARLALNQIFGKSGGLPFFGARAGGGAVNAGGAYLVGERGPEMFVPRQAGAIAPATSGVSVHFHLGAGADAGAIARHQGQIAAQVARAVAYGRRNL
jgi:hypothetical protein